MNSLEKTWASKDAKALTEDFIDHIYSRYYVSYKKESEYYERVNRILYVIITILGFFVTIILGLSEILNDRLGNSALKDVMAVVAFLLPSISSVLLLIMNQMGYKKKEEIREQARIECKFLVNEAKIRFVEVKDDPKAMTELYVWLNQEVKKLQLSQADTYFSVHNMGGLTTVTQVKE